MKELSCRKEWEQRNKLRAEGNKLYAEGNKLWAEGNKLRAEGSKLWAEGNKLWAEGDLVFINAIINKHGNIKIEWKDGDCILENEEHYKVK